MTDEEERCQTCWDEAQGRKALLTAEEIYPRLVKANFCGSHKTVAVNYLINVVESKPPEYLDLAPPCVMGQHRWAYLTYGGVACGYCGRPR